MNKLVLQVPGEPGYTWWSLFHLYQALGILIGAIVVGIMIYFIVKYREGKVSESDDIKPGVVPPERGNIRIIVVFFAFTAVVLFSLASYSMFVTSYIERVPDTDDVIQITVVGYQWGWRFIYPNGTEVVGEVTVPLGKTIVFRITSNDVFHKFQLKDFRVGADALPGAYNVIWIKPEKPGRYLIQCYELCGVGHANMIAYLNVVG